MGEAIEYSERLLHCEEYKGFIIRVFKDVWGRYGGVGVPKSFIEREKQIAADRVKALNGVYEWYSACHAKFFPIHDYSKESPTGMTEVYSKHGLEADLCCNEFNPKSHGHWWYKYLVPQLKTEIDELVKGAA